MLVGWFLQFIAKCLNNFYSLLPDWQFTIGSGPGAYSNLSPDSGDNSYYHFAFMYLSSFDRFVPLHDGLLPIMGVTMLITTGFITFKFIKWGLSLIPGISSGG